MAKEKEKEKAKNEAGYFIIKTDLSWPLVQIFAGPDEASTDCSKPPYKQTKGDADLLTEISDKLINAMRDEKKTVELKVAKDKWDEDAIVKDSEYKPKGIAPAKATPGTTAGTTSKQTPTSANDDQMVKVLKTTIETLNKIKSIESLPTEAYDLLIDLAGSLEKQTRVKKKAGEA